MRAIVEAVFRSASHQLGKEATSSIELLEGKGVWGDAHCGATVQHRSRVARDPAQPNLRQVHLIAAELHDELKARGFSIRAGAMGENIATRGIALLDLPTQTLLWLGESAMIEVTGLRNPCKQLNGHTPGLMTAVLDRDSDGGLIRRAGVMSVVRRGGTVRPGDVVRVELPLPPLRALEPV